MKDNERRLVTGYLSSFDERPAVLVSAAGAESVDERLREKGF